MTFSKDHNLVSNAEHMLNLPTHHPHCWSKSFLIIYFPTFLFPSRLMIKLDARLSWFIQGWLTRELKILSSWFEDNQLNLNYSAKLNLGSVYVFRVCANDKASKGLFIWWIFRVYTCRVRTLTFNYYCAQKREFMALWFTRRGFFCKFQTGIRQRRAQTSEAGEFSEKLIPATLSRYGVLNESIVCAGCERRQ